MKRNLLLSLAAILLFTGWYFRDQDEVLKAKLIFANVVNGVAGGSFLQVQPNLANALVVQDTSGNSILGFTTTTGAPVIQQFYPETLAGATGIVASTGATEALATSVCNTVEMALVSSGSATNTLSLPDTPASGQHCMIKNQTAAALVLFGGSGGTLCISGSACGAGGGTGPIAARTQIDCYADPPGGASPQWECR